MSAPFRAVPESLIKDLEVALTAQCESWKRYIKKNPDAQFAVDSLEMAEDLLKRVIDCRKPD